MRHFRSLATLLVLATSKALAQSSVSVVRSLAELDRYVEDGALVVLLLYKQQWCAVVLLYHHDGLLLYHHYHYHH